MCPYELKTSLETNGYEVRLTSDDRLIGFVRPVDEGGSWVALSLFDVDFSCESDSENRAAEEVWARYQTTQMRGAGDE
ncbi:MAG: hypothetical protein M0R06_04635 [Sphaerochaeta sp.]|jgi:hypothetical protein|nr:hypothetical protein [Sphaerochaeta sp.]